MDAIDMSEAAMLRDCLDTLKHASACYLRASHEADSNRLRETFEHLAIDKAEQKNAVFNLMHQAGMYKTKPADAEDVAELRRRSEQLLRRIGTARAVERERSPGFAPVTMQRASIAGVRTGDDAAGSGRRASHR